jgi:hypothetical protein
MGAQGRGEVLGVGARAARRRASLRPGGACSVSRHVPHSTRTHACTHMHIPTQNHTQTQRRHAPGAPHVVAALQQPVKRFLRQRRPARDAPLHIVPAATPRRCCLRRRAPAGRLCRYGGPDAGIGARCGRRPKRARRPPNRRAPVPVGLEVLPLLGRRREPRARHAYAARDARRARLAPGCGGGGGLLLLLLPPRGRGRRVGGRRGRRPRIGVAVAGRAVPTLWLRRAGRGGGARAPLRA